jgi:predicted porin
MLTGKYDFTPEFALKAGYEHTVQSTPSSSNDWNTQITTYYGMSIAGLVTAKAFDPTWGNAPVTTAWIGEGYKYSENVVLDAGYYNVNNGGNNHNDQYTIQALSFMADYYFNKRTDVYIGLMFTHYSGPYLEQQSPPTLVTSNAIFGTGLRLKF